MAMFCATCGGDPDRAQAVDERGHVVSLVGAEGAAVAAVQAAQHGYGGVAFGCAGRRQRGIDNQAVSVLHQQVAHMGLGHMAELGFLATPFAEQPGIGVSGRGVGVVAELLRVEVTRSALRCRSMDLT